MECSKKKVIIKIIHQELLCSYGMGDFFFFIIYHGRFSLSGTTGFNVQKGPTLL